MVKFGRRSLPSDEDNDSLSFSVPVVVLDVVVCPHAVKEETDRPRKEEDRMRCCRDAPDSQAWEDCGISVESRTVAIIVVE